MKNQIQKAVLILITVISISVCSGTYASFPDVYSTASYHDAVNNLATLGIISGDEKGHFNPDAMLTREQFARLIIASAGQDNRAEVLKDMIIFPDVSPSRWSSGYINAAVQMGYITGMLDGRFHPVQNVTFAQVCTVLVKMLGYNDNDVIGIWPQSFIIKAKELGITSGTDFSGNDPLPRWAVAVMLDNLLLTPVKSDHSKTFMQTIERYTQHIILANSKTMDTLSPNEVLTDKGTFYIKESSLNLEPGKKYQLNIERDTIKGIYGEMGYTLNISVEGVSGTKVSYREDGMQKSLDLPSRTVYYYDGKVLAYENLSNIVHTNSSIILNRNDTGTGYEYAVILDPIYSNPEIAKRSYLSSDKIGNIKFEEGVKITKNGRIISPLEIEYNDVVYMVSDIWDKNKYILVLNSNISGEITAILPNKISPRSIEINNVNYELGKHMDISKINSYGMMELNDSVTVLIGYDGKVVDIVMNTKEDNSHYAFVINNYKKTSTSIEDFGKEINYVKLLHTDNTIRTYELKNNETGYNGELVKFRIVDDKNEFWVVELEKLKYLSAQEYTIDKDSRKIDSNYFADNIKIYNVVSTIFGNDSHGHLLNWSELPNGIIPPGKIKYLNKVGDFGDINVMFLDNIFDEDKRLGIVTDTQIRLDQQQQTVYSNTILIDGKQYVTNSHVEGLHGGAVVQVRMWNDQVMAIEQIRGPVAQATTIEASDSKRIKINGNIYEFKNNMAIYFRSLNGSYIRKGINDIVQDESYGRISVYLDKAGKYGGKVELIVVSR